MIRLNLFMIWFLHFLSLLSVICRYYRQNSSSRIIVVLVYTVSTFFCAINQNANPTLFGRRQCANRWLFMATGHLYINTRDELIRLDCSKIVYMEGDGNYTNIVLANKQKVSVCMNLSHMQQFISESLRERASIFARIGKRFIVNLNFILNSATL